MRTYRRRNVHAQTEPPSHSGRTRFADVVGIYAGTFDDPNWFDRSPATTKHIFTGVAQKGTILPPGYNTFTEHAWLNDGTEVAPTVFSGPTTITSRQ